MNTDQHGLLHKEITEKVIGIYYDLYKNLGFGFLESVYENAFYMELAGSGLFVQRQIAIPVWYKSQQIGDFRADLLVERVVLLELKAVRVLDSSHESQVINYLRASEIELGLLFNFGPRPQSKRIVLTNDKKGIRVHPRSSAVSG